MVELYRIFEEFQIRKHLKRQPARQVVAKNYQEIESVCLISEAGFLKSDHPLITIQRAFQKEGKKIEIVGFFGESEIPRGLTGSPFFIINKNDITWYGKLKTVVTDKIKDQKYDLVIVYNPNKNYHINYLAMKSKGLLKIGMAPMDMIIFTTSAYNPIKRDCHILLI